MRSRLRLGHPIWLDRRPLTQSYPTLAGTHQADVVIVGAGFTGALVADAFASAGISVVVLEAALAAAGSTAASSALLLHEPDVGFAGLERRYGTRTSRRLWQLSREAVQDLVARLGRLKVSCGLQRRDAIYYATSSEEARRLWRELERRTRAGFDARWLSAGQLRRACGIPGHAAIRTSGSAQLDPYRASLGVLRTASIAGARIFERSRVVRIETSGKGVRVQTHRGSVDARRVIIATGYATPSFRPLAGHFRMYRTYVLATAPMRASERRELGLPDVLVWDTERPYHYARWTADHRLLLGGADRAVRPGARRDLQFMAATRALREYFERLLPALGSASIQTAWEGFFAVTPDSLPYIGPHRRYPRHWFALGYGGNGMTFGSIAARLLVERWHGATSPDHQLFAFDRVSPSRGNGYV